MHTSQKWLIPALAASVLLAACGSSSTSSSSSSTVAAQPAAAQPSGEGSGVIVKTASNPALGATILVDAHGMTLYHLSGERAGKFICTSAACLQVWHPLVAEGAGTPRGSVGSLATVKRPDGTEQVTYNGMPLYTFTQDQAAGNTRGQGIKDVGTWSAVTAAATKTGSPTTTTTSTPATTTSTQSGGGAYGY